jgi:hypothetical protein
MAGKCISLTMLMFANHTVMLRQHNGMARRVMARTETSRTPIRAQEQVFDSCREEVSMQRCATVAGWPVVGGQMRFISETQGTRAWPRKRFLMPCGAFTTRISPTRARLIFENKGTYSVVGLKTVPDGVRFPFCHSDNFCAAVELTDSILLEFIHGLVKPLQAKAPRECGSGFHVTLCSCEFDVSRGLPSSLSRSHFPPLK